MYILKNGLLDINLLLQILVIRCAEMRKLKIPSVTDEGYVLDSVKILEKGLGKKLK